MNSASNDEQIDKISGDILRVQDKGIKKQKLELLMSLLNQRKIAGLETTSDKKTQRVLTANQIQILKDYSNITSQDLFEIPDSSINNSDLTKYINTYNQLSSFYHNDLSNNVIDISNLCQASQSEDTYSFSQRVKQLLDGVNSMKASITVTPATTRSKSDDMDVDITSNTDTSMSASTDSDINIFISKINSLYNMVNKSCIDASSKDSAVKYVYSFDQLKQLNNELNESMTKADAKTEMSEILLTISLIKNIIEAKIPNPTRFNDYNELINQLNDTKSKQRDMISNIATTAYNEIMYNKENTYLCKDILQLIYLYNDSGPPQTQETQTLLAGIENKMFQYYFFYQTLETYDPINNEIDNILDGLMELPETESELLQAQQHIQNVTNMYQSFFKKEDTEVALTEVTSSSTTLGKRKNSQRGGSTPFEEICNGNYLDQNTVNSKQLVSALGITKTLDELLHDFSKPSNDGSLYLNKEMIGELKHIYTAFIDTMIDNVTNYPEEIINYMKKVKGFSIIHDPTEMLTDKEWNYYASTLKFLDDYCNKMGNLNIFKYKKVKNIDSMNDASKEFLTKQGYIKTITKLTDNEDTSMDVEDIGTDYLYTTLSMDPIKPIFSITDVDKRFEDNVTRYSLLKPLLPDGALTEKSELKNYITAPSLLDPSTTSSSIKYTIFTSGDDIQIAQNIDASGGDNEANRITKQGLIDFASYFGASIDKGNLSNITISFAKNIDGNIIGVNISSISGNSYSLHIGDTTIDNISKLVKSFNNEPIEYKENDYPNIINTNDSWKRLYDYGRFIFKNIPGTIINKIGIGYWKSKTPGGSGTGMGSVQILNNWIFTEIIISLKSMGDSLQVNYDKRMNNYLNSDKFISEKFQKPINTYISSSDKNVAAESFLIDGPFLINGTGMRPHNKLFKEYSVFFGKDCLKQFTISDCKDDFWRTKELYERYCKELKLEESYIEITGSHDGPYCAEKYYGSASDIFEKYYCSKVYKIIIDSEHSYYNNLENALKSEHLSLWFVDEITEEEYESTDEAFKELPKKRRHF